MSADNVGTCGVAVTTSTDDEFKAIISREPGTLCQQGTSQVSEHQHLLAEVAVVIRRESSGGRLSTWPEQQTQAPTHH